MSTEIIEGDFLITTFMGYTYSNESEVWKYVYYDIHYYSGKWELLMPVVERIEDLGYQFKQCRKRVEIYEDWKTCSPNEDIDRKPITVQKSETKILSAWLAVVFFIKWYHNQIAKQTL